MRHRFQHGTCLIALIAALGVGAEGTAPAAESARIERDSPIFADTKIGTVPTSRPVLAAFDAPACPLEERLLADAADGRLGEFQPLAAALVASGVEDVDGLRHYQEKAAALAEQLRRSTDVAGTARDRAAAVLSFLHRRVFCRGYDLAYTDLRRVLDDGRFNCVSATVLFNYFAGELGLQCRGLEMPGHAMSRIRLTDSTLDVETTCPSWFQWNAKPQQLQRVATGPIGDAASADRSNAREVSATELIAMIYYNRGVEMLAEKRFAAAAALNAKAVRLDPHNATARGNLSATINNWSIELGNRGEYAEAVALLRRGLAMDPKFQPFVQNYIHVHRQWIDALRSQGHVKEADDILVAALTEMPDGAALGQMQRELRAADNK